MQRSGALLYGFEKDVNRLIDEYALQAELEQSFSFNTFKKLFKAGGYAYLHQAYPGCEHSTEYTQLLFATALDRLDMFSPTASPESPLWLHHVGKACAAAAAAGMARGAAEKAAEAEAAAQAATCSHAPAPVAVAAAVNTTQPDVSLQQTIAAVKNPVPSVQQANLRHTCSQDSLAANNIMPGESSNITGMLEPLQQQQRCSDPLQGQQQQQSAEQNPCLQPLQQRSVQLPVLHQQQQLQSPALQAQLPTNMQWPQPQAQLQQQVQQMQEQQPMLMQPVQLQHHREQQQEQQQQCRAPGLLQHHQQASVQPLSHLHQLAQLRSQQSGQLPPHQPFAQILQQQQAALLPDQQVQYLPGQQQQQLEVVQCDPTPPDEAAATVDILADEMSSDDFLNDLLAIFDEAEEWPQDDAGSAPLLEQLQEKEMADGDTAATQKQGSTPAAAQLPESAPGQQRQQQQRWYTPPAMFVPLAVKAAVVFTLHCLYETQLSLPKVCIYTSLEHLKELKTAAADFSAAGQSAADVLAVLQVLIKQDRLLIGQFRRPAQWKPQLPMWLAPPPSKWPDLGLGSLAANCAAARAGGPARGAARIEAVKSAANIVRSLRDHKPNEVDPIVHRDAMFHIKTALRSLANFKGLQALCSKYTSARRAIFEPLLRTKDTAVQQELAVQASNSKGRHTTGCEKGVKRACMSKQPASKRSRLNPAGVSIEAAAAEQAEAPAAAAQQQVAAAAVAAATAIGVPELFDCNFGSALAHLADDEATNMLMLLDPAKNPHQVKRKLKQQAEAAKQAAADGNNAAELRQLAGGSKKMQKRRGKPGPIQAGSDAGLGQPNYVKELLDAGIINPMELQDLEDETLESQGSVPGFGAARQVLQKRQRQTQRTLSMAEQWFRSHDAMIQLGDLDDGEDMP